MQLVNDHVVMVFDTDIEGPDLTEVSKALRPIKTDFSDDSKMMKDVQVVLDENYVNYQFFNLFYQEKQYSATDLLLQYIPEDYLSYAQTLIKLVFNTGLWSLGYKDLGDKYGLTNRIDLRCSFSKEFLQEGNLDNAGVSRIKFHEGNVVDGEVNFGCSLFVYNKPQIEGLNSMLELFESISNDVDDPAWEKYSTFFLSGNLKVEFDVGEDAKIMSSPLDQLNDHANDFLSDWGIPKVDLTQYVTDERFKKSDDSRKRMPMVFAKLLSFKFTPKEVKVYDSTDKEMYDAEEDFTRAFDEATLQMQENYQYKMGINQLFQMPMPISQFPEVQDCLGLKSKDSQLEFREGYVILAFDYQVK